MADTDTPIWFITGCSTGFGRALAAAVIARGWRVAATARDADRLADLVETAPDRVLALSLDVTDAGQIAAAVEAARARFGGVDVLVNNAGYGYQASIEEGEEDRIRAQFDTNVFGLFATTRAVLPLMRGGGGGTIVNVTSLAGFVGFPGSGYYAATKHAVEGFSDALAAEGAPIGIRAICVEPGPFRTDWAGRSLEQTPVRIEAYADTAGKRLAATSGYSGTQAGDPVRAAQAIIDAVGQAEPPRHLVLGRFAYEHVVEVLRTRLAEIEAGKDRSLSADFPDGEG